jgi:hypothetical protein
VEVTDSNKHPNLLQFRIHYGNKKYNTYTTNTPAYIAMEFFAPAKSFITLAPGSGFACQAN